MANVKVFADKQTDARTNRWAKNSMPPIYRCGGIKKKTLESVCRQQIFCRRNDNFPD